MRKFVFIIIFFAVAAHCFSQDLIITKQDKKYKGKVVKLTEKGFILRLVDGTIIVVPKKDIVRIHRGKMIIDLEKKMRYYKEVHHPYLPLLVLGIAAGAYSIKKIGDYQNEKDRIKKHAKEMELNPALKNIDDNSGEYLTHCIISGLLCLGSSYIAFRPMEVTIPIGPIKMSANYSYKRVMLSFHF